MDISKLQQVQVATAFGYISVPFEIKTYTYKSYMGDSEHTMLILTLALDLFRNRKQTLYIDLQHGLDADEQWLNEQLEQRLKENPQYADYYGAFSLREISFNQQGEINMLYWLEEGNSHRQARGEWHSVHTASRKTETGEVIHFISPREHQIYW